MNLENRFVRHGLRLLFSWVFGKSVSKSLNLFYLNPKSDPIEDRDLVFVFQGPIIFGSELYQGLADYRRIFPNSQIILSTWNKADVDVEYLQSQQIDSVFPLQPVNTGILGVNRQIVGVGAAIDCIHQWRRKSGTTVFKLRTDYFPRKPCDLYWLLKSLEGIFGNHRIWGVDINTKKNIPFSFADIMNCGSYENMRMYWASDVLNGSNIGRTVFLSATEHGQSIDKVVEYGTPETYLMRRYLKRRGFSLNVNSLSDYHDMLAKELGILDADQIGLAFDKYTVIKSGSSSSVSAASDLITFAEWIFMASRNE